MLNFAVTTPTINIQQPTTNDQQPKATKYRMIEQANTTRDLNMVQRDAPNTWCVWVDAKRIKGRFKRTTPGIPTWSPTVVLTWPDNA